MNNIAKFVYDAVSRSSTPSRWSLKRRLFSYMMLLVCLLLLFLVTALFLTDQFDNIEENTFDALEMQIKVFEKAQLELQRLTYSRRAEIDPDAYIQFLDGIETLTPTERKIFNYYPDGLNVKEIAETISVKESTVYSHNKNIYSKLGINSLKQLLRYSALMRQQEKERE